MKGTIPAHLGNAFGHIYIMAVEDHSLYKIGTSRDVSTLRTRFDTLRAGCPYYSYIDSAFLVKAPYLIEKRIHLSLEHNWVRGEWFEMAPELLDRIKMALKEFTLPCDCKACAGEWRPVRRYKPPTFFGTPEDILLLEAQEPLAL